MGHTRRLTMHSLVPLVTALLAGSTLAMASPTTFGNPVNGAAPGAAGNVSYDGRSLIIDGRRELLFSGCIHYPRSTPEMWPDLLAKAKANGIDVIETYTFWDLHEPQPGVYDFSGRNDVIRFLKAAQDAGLYVNLRVGPYVCAEWNYGGIPVRLREVDGMVFRTYNQPWMDAMSAWVKYIVDYMKDAGMFYSQGGPVILAQIENEYGNIEKTYPLHAKYVQWAADFANELDVGVPWIMCQQSDAPKNVINTCNGFYCDQFIKGHWESFPNEPPMWTENWPGWFQQFGAAVPHRPSEDVAFAVARWVSQGGAFMNYYMWHGGTNFDRTVGGPLITTSYDYDVSLDEYGLIHEPKYSHLGDMHAVFKANADIILAQMPPGAVDICDSVADKDAGCSLQAIVYNNSNGCVAFLSNIDSSSTGTGVFQGRRYDIPGWSVSILPGCVDVAYNTAEIKVASNSLSHRVESVAVAPDATPLGVPVNDDFEPASSFTNLGYLFDTIGVWDAQNVSGTTRHAATPLEQLDITRDSTDYLWYTATLSASAGTQTLKVSDPRDVVHVFYSAGSGSPKYAGILNKSHTTVDVTVPSNGTVNVMMLSTSVGIQNYGAHMELIGKGVQGDITLGATKVTSPANGWLHQIGLQGYSWLLMLPNTKWATFKEGWPTSAIGSPVTWYRANFTTPTGTDPVVIDMSSMTKGTVWVNEHNIGRYYSVIASDLCTGCDYRGAFNPEKCRTDCGHLSQTKYHVPREWLNASGPNYLVILEEAGGDPTKIAIETVRRNVQCAQIGEQWPQGGTFVALECQDGHKITSIDFASFGTPTGVCGSFATGSCNAANSTAVVSKMCLGQQSCQVSVLDSLFGDPCPSTTKHLYVQAQCT